MDIKLHWCGNQIGTVQYNKIATADTKRGSLDIDISQWAIVPNQVRCLLWYDTDNKEFKAIPFKQGKNQIIKVALIVESPHKDEFTYDFRPLRPLNGFSGVVFDNQIDRKMDNWFKGNINKTAVYEIKIFNPVQYQTSLFHFLNNMIPFMRLSEQLKDGTVIPEYVFDDHKKLRDNVWKLLFDSALTQCKINFQKQLIQYWPEYIINCCTGGSAEDRSIYWTTVADRQSSASNVSTTQNNSIIPKQHVRDALNELDDWFLKTIKYREDFHPSRWKFDGELEKKDGKN